MDKRSY